MHEFFPSEDARPGSVAAGRDDLHENQPGWPRNDEKKTKKEEQPMAPQLRDHARVAGCGGIPAVSLVTSHASPFLPPVAAAAGGQAPVVAAGEGRGGPPGPGRAGIGWLTSR